MSSDSSPALALDIDPLWSVKRGAGAMVCLLVLVLALMTLGLMRGSLASGAMLTGGVLGTVTYALHQAGYWRPARRLQRLVWTSQGDCELLFADGRLVAACLSAHSWMTPWMWCLRFEAGQVEIPAVLVWRTQVSTTVWQLWRTRLFLEGRRSARAMDRFCDTH